VGALVDFVVVNRYATVIQLVEMEGLLVLCSATQVEGGSGSN
jgi:hypothetical protein